MGIKDLDSSSVLGICVIDSVKVNCVTCFWAGGGDAKSGNVYTNGKVPGMVNSILSHL